MRIVRQAQGERYIFVKSLISTSRNYHIFYQLCAGADEDEREEWHLGTAESFHYLNQSNCFQIDGVDDEADLEQLKSALDCLDINESQQSSIFKIISAVLHLGNIRFSKKGTLDSAVIDNTQGF